ncbi:MAG TPA: glycosyltransferase family 4 protein, partial [Nonomuraea sp.]|nr:glycosyltransferase family 4 protein [Nonomuraea sp.]
LRDVRSFRPDLLHLHYAGGRLGSLALLAGLHPLVVTVMGGDVLPEQHLGGRSILEARATRHILEEADLVLVKADSLRPAVVQQGGDEARITTVRWGVDPDTFRRDRGAAGEARARLGLEARDRVILSPRALSPLYNTHLLVEALPVVVRTVPEARLVLTEYGGDPDYRARLLGRAEALGMAGHVRLAGVVPHRDMPSLYSLADVVVMTPSSDGLPQSLFEAMACEAPVVLGRLAVYEEVVTPGESALLVALDPASIAEAVLAVLRDPSLAGALASSALRRVRERASLPAEVERVEALYRQALSMPRRRVTFRRRARRWVDAATVLAR